MAIALGLVLSVGSARAQDECIGFLEKPVDTGGLSGADAVFAADIDGDGDIDVLSASHNDNKIAWFEHKINLITSEIEFVEHVITADAESASSVFAADFDSDGDMDVVSASRDDDIVAWYDNDGSTPPGFRKRTVTSELQVPMAVFVADVNGDGAPDVVTASFADNKIAWHENRIGQQGITTQFMEHVVTIDAEGAAAVYAGDLDGDGDTDIVSASRVDDTIAWYEQQVNPQTAEIEFAEHILTTTAEGATSVFAAKIDDDNLLDIVAASTLDNSIRWFENDTGFSEHIVTTTASGARSVFAGDLTGDGQAEIVAASSGDNTVAWYENLGGATPSFARNVISSDTVSADAVFVIDIDEDVSLDLDVLSISSATGTTQTQDKLAWYENDLSAPSFPEHLIAGSASGAESLVSADVDMDGVSDLVAARSDGPLIWFDNDGAADPSFIEREVAATALNATVVRAVDLDGDLDQDVDVVAAFRDQNRIAWYEQEIDAQTSELVFTEHEVPTTADLIEDVFVADIDGDGHRDLLSASFNDDAIAWYESDGAAPPSFTEHVISTTVCLLEPATTCGDDSDCEGVCDGDGTVCLADFECVDHGGESICTGGLGPCEPQAEGAQSVFAADVDGDGDTDILSASSSNNRISWWENQVRDPPDPSDPIEFTQHSFVLGGAAIVVAGDIDGDGDTDIVGSSTIGTISWWNNRDDDDEPLGFTEVPVGIISGLRELELVDFDLDGATDLVTLSSGQTRIAWFQNNQASTTGFFARVVPGSAVDGRSVAVADLNGDTKMDFAGGYRAEIAWYEQLDEYCQTFDANGDGVIDGIELSWLSRAFGSVSDDPMVEWWSSVDFNRDGVIDGDDLSILASNGVWARTTETCSYACQ